MSADEHDWLTYAQADLHVAQLLAAHASVPGRIACFHAQQAAEKALKAALVATGKARHLRSVGPGPCLCRGGETQEVP